MQKTICQKYAKNMPNIQNNVHDIQNKIQNYASNMQNLHITCTTCQIYAKHMQNICKTYAKNVQKMQKICNFFTEGLTNLQCLQYAKYANHANHANHGANIQNMHGGLCWWSSWQLRLHTGTAAWSRARLRDSIWNLGSASQFLNTPEDLELYHTFTL